MNEYLKRPYPKILNASTPVLKSHCLNCVVLEDFDSKLIITSLNDQNNIKNSIILDKRKNSLTVKHYSKINKPNYCFALKEKLFARVLEFGLKFLQALMFGPESINSIFSLGIAFNIKHKEGQKNKSAFDAGVHF